MIVDVHTHFWNAREDLGPEVYQDMKRAGGVSGNLDITPDSYFEGTKGADLSIAFGIRASRTGFHVSNDRVAQFAHDHSERVIAFASADPLADKEPVKEIRRGIEDLGMKGIKLAPTYQGVHPLDDRLMSVYEFAEEKKVPILFHQGATFSLKAPLSYANPVQLEEIAYRFSELTMIIAHMGHPWIGETVTLIRKQPNVYADISALYYRPWQYYNALKLAEEYGAAHKLLFGSDFPFTTVENSIKGLYGIASYAEQHNLPPIPKDLLDGILYRESLQLLGL